MRLSVLVMLCMIPALLFGQQLLVNPSSANNTWNYFFTVVDTAGGVPLIGSEVRNRTMTATTSDTLQAIFVPHVKTIYFNIMVAETSTTYIDYAVSEDGSSYTAFTLKDSLTYQADAIGTKSIDFTSTILGHAFVKFRVRVSQLAFALGSTNPKYWASYTLKLR
jgi:hypothetical protein